MFLLNATVPASVLQRVKLNIFPRCCSCLLYSLPLMLPVTLLAPQASGSRKLLWGGLGLFGGNHWNNWFSAPRNYWGWSAEPQQDSHEEQAQQASPASLSYTHQTLPTIYSV
jgi:hypothetical protein